MLRRPPDNYRGQLLSKKEEGMNCRCQLQHPPTSPPLRWSFHHLCPRNHLLSRAWQPAGATVHPHRGHICTLLATAGGHFQAPNATTLWPPVLHNGALRTPSSRRLASASTSKHPLQTPRPGLSPEPGTPAAQGVATPPHRQGDPHNRPPLPVATALHRRQPPHQASLLRCSGASSAHSNSTVPLHTWPLRSRASR